MSTELPILLLCQRSVLTNTSKVYPTTGKFTRRIALIPWAEAVEVVFNVPACQDLLYIKVSVTSLHVSASSLAIRNFMS